MTETRIIYGPAETTGCPSPTEVINRALAAGSCHIITTAPDAVQAQARIAALEAALDEIRLIAIGEIEIMSDRQKRWNGKELYQIAKKAESALKKDEGK